jgi:sulfite dehydrogenase (quinone) subunit SoeC
MHPAYSVIVFTTTSGAGYGLLFWLGLRTALPHDGAAGGWSDLIALTIGLSLATLGLLSSALHLGRPTRAWRAFSQWRTSWLSREAVAAMVTYVPAGLLGLGWLWPGLVPALPLFGLLLAAGAAATVWCTGMIYGCLRTIPAWNLARVPVVYLLLGAGTGGAILTIIDAAAGGAAQFQAAVSAVSVGAGLALKLSYWSHIDTATLGQDRASALGIPGASRIRPLDPPHTQPNFVMREMGYQVARRHADRLRLICKVLLTLSTAALLLAAVLPGATLPLAALAVMVAAPAVFMERWLFFAQARHLSMLYY